MAIIPRGYPFLFIVAFISISSTEGRLGESNSNDDNMITTDIVPNVDMDTLVQEKTSEMQRKAVMIEQLRKEELHYKSEIKRMAMMLSDLERSRNNKKLLHQQSWQVRTPKDAGFYDSDTLLWLWHL